MNDSILVLMDDGVINLYSPTSSVMNDFDQQPIFSFMDSDELVYNQNFDGFANISRQDSLEFFL